MPEHQLTPELTQVYWTVVTSVATHIALLLAVTVTAMYLFKRGWPQQLFRDAPFQAAVLLVLWVVNMLASIGLRLLDIVGLIYGIVAAREAYVTLYFFDCASALIALGLLPWCLTGLCRKAAYRVRRPAVSAAASRCASTVRSLVAET